jgi:hypothetical protein
MAASAALMQRAESSMPLEAQARVKSGTGATLPFGSGMPLPDSDFGMERNGRRVPRCIAACASCHVYW